MELFRNRHNNKERVSILETHIKHLINDLRLTREENETSMSDYFEIHSYLEKKVEERTRDIKALQKKLEQKAQELESILDS
ncbi:hypothetical protein ACFL0H_14000, partial [Thermodesulfobacteriota bacterium]